jgi:hypothetical protein
MLDLSYVEIISAVLIFGLSGSHMYRRPSKQWKYALGLSFLGLPSSGIVPKSEVLSLRIILTR